MPDHQSGAPVMPCQDELIELFETLVNVMFCAKDGAGIYIAVNAAFVRRTGRSSKRDVIGRTAGEIFHPDLAERYAEQDQAVLGLGHTLRDELELIRRPGGELGWYLTTKLPVVDRAAPDRVAGLVSVSRDLLTPTSESIALESLQQVVAYVRDNLNSMIRVDDLASAAGCSPAQLDRRMKRVFGITPKQYVLKARVDQATRLLATSDLPLSDVAAQVGFYDQSDFTRRFARLTNQTPAQFRSHHRQP